MFKDTVECGPKDMLWRGPQCALPIAPRSAEQKASDLAFQDLSNLRDVTWPEPIIRRQGFKEGPAIILVVPQMGENIGKAARAMYNFGLTDLRMVTPRDGWPNEKAISAASGADVVIEQAKIFNQLEDAVGDLQLVLATTARDRHMVKPVITPAEAAGQIRAAEQKGLACGILFGGEKAGLKNEHAVLAQKLVSVPVNPAFASLNLAQAVLLMAYEWFQAADSTAPESIELLGSEMATSAELVGFFRAFGGGT